MVSTSQSASQTAPLPRGTSGEEGRLYEMPRPLLDRSNNDDRRRWRKQGVAVGAAASKTQTKCCGCWVPQPGQWHRAGVTKRLFLNHAKTPAVHQHCGCFSIGRISGTVCHYFRLASRASIFLMGSMMLETDMSWFRATTKYAAYLETSTSTYQSRVSSSGIR